MPFLGIKMVHACKALEYVVKNDYSRFMPEYERRISWLKVAALKDFQEFPRGAQIDIATALTEAERGSKADTAKPFKGVGSGVFEIAIRHRGDAFRAIYAVQIGEDIWVIDAFQKKSKSGIKTPQMDVDRIKQRLSRLKEVLR
jgi:phage-related protein